MGWRLLAGVLGVPLALQATPCVADYQQLAPEERALDRAIGLKKLDDLRAIIGVSWAVDRRTSRRNTALLMAVRRGWLEGATFLLEQGADVDLAEPDGSTPLIIAAQQGDRELVRLLAKAGANPRLADSLTGRSALQWAQLKGLQQVILQPDGPPRFNGVRSDGPFLRGVFAEWIKHRGLPKGWKFSHDRDDAGAHVFLLDADPTEQPMTATLDPMRSANNLMRSFCNDPSAAGYFSRGLRLRIDLILHDNGKTARRQGELVAGCSKF